jgi:hypothetical protein
VRGDRHIRAFQSEMAADMAAGPLAGPGDEGDPSGELQVHRVPLRIARELDGIPNITGMKGSRLGGGAAPAMLVLPEN